MMREFRLEECGGGLGDGDDNVAIFDQSVRKDVVSRAERASGFFPVYSLLLPGCQMDDQ